MGHTELDNTYWLLGLGNPEDGLTDVKSDLVSLLRLAESGIWSPGILRPIRGTSSMGGRRRAVFIARFSASPFDLARYIFAQWPKPNWRFLCRGQAAGLFVCSVLAPSLAIRRRTFLDGSNRLRISSGEICKEIIFGQMRWATWESRRVLQHAAPVLWP